MNELKEKILSLEPGTPFIASDFKEYGRYDAVRKTLIRMEGEGAISRLIDGVYFIPRKSDFLGVSLLPRMEAIASTIARKFGWNIVPAPETAANLLGLTTQVSARYAFLSDGPYREYDIAGASLSFKHTANRNIFGLSPNSALLVQALRSPEGMNISDGTRKEIAHRLGIEAVRVALRECRGVPVRIYEEMERILEVATDD